MSENKKNLVTGTHLARCVSIIHMGTIPTEWQGVKKMSKKIRITWELPNKKIERNGKEYPVLMSKEYTYSFYKDAGLKKMIDGWRGKALTEEQANTFDVSKLLGVACMITIIKKVSGKGTEYTDISSASPVMEGMQCPEQISKSFEFKWENFNQSVFDRFPDFIKRVMETSDEYKALKSGSNQSEQNQEVKKEDIIEDLSDVSDVDDSELPF